METNTSETGFKIVPESAMARFFLGRRFLRVLGYKLFPIYIANLQDGNKMYLRSRFGFDAATVTEVVHRDIYERYYSIQRGDVVLDVGAHIGSFTLKAAKEVGPSGRVVSFEPSSENFKMLEKNVRINDYANVTLFNMAVGAEEGTGRLKLNVRKGGNSFFDRGSDVVGTEEVRIASLDSVLKELELPKIDFLKIDVEGFELNVLEGAEDLLRVHHPKIAMETHEFGPSSEQLSDHLSKCKYSVHENQYRSGLGLLYAS